MYFIFMDHVNILFIYIPINIVDVNDIWGIKIDQSNYTLKMGIDRNT